MLLRTTLALAASLSLMAATDTYGRAIQIKEETRITDLLAHPDRYVNREVRVRGVILQVCQSRGCMMMLKGEDRFQKLQVKVEDGVIRFPADGAGREAVVEGTFRVKEFSETEVKKLCATQRKALFGKDADAPGPRKFYRLDGLGAEIRR